MYKMISISEQVRVGQTSDGDFDIEVWPPTLEGERSRPDGVLLPRGDAEEVAKYILRNS